MGDVVIIRRGQIQGALMPLFSERMKLECASIFTLNALVYA